MTEHFLDWLFSDAVGPNRRVVLFTVPEKRARFFDDHIAAEIVSRKLAETQDVYFGVGLIQGTPEGRGKRDDVVGIGALWADIDFASVAHPDKALPTDDEDFQSLLDELPLPPSVVLDSGNGRHVYWLLQEPWQFADAEDRRQAAQLSHAWHEVVCLAAKRRGWKLENLGDLTRILRLPGTLNHKQPDCPVAVRIVEVHQDRRYSIDDFEPYLPEVMVADNLETDISAPHVEIDAEPPTDKFESALTESPLFRQTWERSRVDLGDQSASAYDLSLASLAVLRGWSDEEIASLLVAWRRQHGERPEKATRFDYLIRTLTRARASASEDGAAVDLSAFQFGPPLVLQDAAPQSSPDPGPMPEMLCRIPGFVSDVMDHCLATAPYPNVPLAFCGALALQALLAGRKVRDEADNRTNIYLLALAYSAVGKDWPRKVNTAILHKIGLIDSLGEKFASGEGIQAALLLNPSLLFQTDEIDSMLQSINKARDARHENILSTLLTMYSAANSIYPMRRKAGKEAPSVIDQPNLVIYGTAIPNHYYGALSERMLTNGFFARMLIVESGRRSVGQDPGLIDPSRHLLDTAQWWSDYNPGKGNLGDCHPQPRVVLATELAKHRLRDGRREAESEYSIAEARGDAVGTTVWGRVQEQTRKLALLYAVSNSHEDPVIDVDAVDWTTQFVMHQSRRMLFMANGHVAENPFHGECLKLIKKLREAPERQLPHSVLMKRMKLDTKSFQSLIETLTQQGDIEISTVKTSGRSGLHYRLIGETSAEGETTSPPEILP